MIPTPLQPDYTLLLGITLCHLAEKAAQTHQLSWVKIKGPLLSFIFLALHLLGSQVASHGSLFSLRSAEFIGSACVGYTHAASTNLSGNMDAAEVFRLKPFKVGMLGRSYKGHRTNLFGFKKMKLGLM